MHSFQPEQNHESPKARPKAGRLIVVSTGPVSNRIIEQLGKFGTVKGVLHRYNGVVVVPHGPKDVNGIKKLSFVASVERDNPRHLTDVGTWDRDILDVDYVEETGSVGNPDEREVDETGAGITVAVIDTGLISNWRDYLPEDQVDVDLARSFTGGVGKSGNEFDRSSNGNLWQRDTNSHGTAVSSHVIGFNSGTVFVDGVAPEADDNPAEGVL